MSGNDVRSEGRLTASVERVRRELDHLLEVAFAQGGRALDMMGFRGQGRPWTPAVDVIEGLEELHVYVDLPGIDPRAIDVTIAENILTVKGDAPLVAAEKTETVHARERPVGPFTRSIPMPVPVDPDAVFAEAKDGVLHVRLGKAEQARARHVQIRVESGPIGTA